MLADQRLPDVQKFVGLEGKAPEWMAFDKVDGGFQELLPPGGVRDVAGLEKEVAGGEPFPGEDFFLGERAVVNQLNFIGLDDGYFAAFRVAGKVIFGT